MTNEASNYVRALPYPAIESSKMSYSNGRYEMGVPEALPDGVTGVLVRHQLSGAPLIDSLLSQGKAQYAVQVASRLSAYRRLHLLDLDDGNNGGVALHSPVEQAVEWAQGDVAMPLEITPLVLYTARDALAHTVDAERDGLSAAWDGVQGRV